MVNASSYRVRVHTTTSDDTLLRTTCSHSQSINYYTRTLFLYPLGLHWRLRFSRNPPSLLGSFSTRLCVPASCFTTNIYRHRRATITVYVYDINIITTTTTKRPLLRLATDKYTEYVGPGPGSVIWYIYTPTRNTAIPPDRYPSPGTRPVREALLRPLRASFRVKRYCCTPCDSQRVEITPNHASILYSHAVLVLCAPKSKPICSSVFIFIFNFPSRVPVLDIMIICHYVFCARWYMLICI